MEPVAGLLHRRRRHGWPRRRRGRLGDGGRDRAQDARGARSPRSTAFKQAPTDAGRRGLVQLLQSAVLSAHQAVFQRGQSEPDKQGMGTTLDVVLVAGPEAFVAHVGDSRTYLIRDGKSSQITTDHTVAEVLVIEGKLTIEEAQVSPLRTILVNAIGVSADVGVEMAHVTLKRGDRLLLCSDGLHDYFPAEEEIAQRLSADAPGRGARGDGRAREDARRPRQHHRRRRPRARGRRRRARRQLEGDDRPSPSSCPSTRSPPTSRPRPRSRRCPRACRRGSWRSRPPRGRRSR